MASFLNSKESSTDGSENSSKRSARLNKSGTAPALSHLEFVGDRSGSMVSMGNVPTQKAKELIQDQLNLSETTGGCIEMSITTFDSISETWYENTDVKELANITPVQWKKMMQPRNRTRLIDTIYERATAQDNYIKRYLEKLPKEVKELNPVVKRTLIVITDGFDNDSERSAEELKVLITELQEDGVTAIFLGANQDAIVSGGNMGFAVDTTMTMGSDPEHAEKAMGYVNSMCRAVSSDADGSARPCFTPLERVNSAPSNGIFDSSILGPPPPFTPQLNRYSGGLTPPTISNLVFGSTNNDSTSLLESLSFPMSPTHPEAPIQEE